jgi:hypothetical protein
MIESFTAMADDTTKGAIKRRMCLGPLVAALRDAPGRPAWSAMFAKGWGIVAETRPELRRLFVKLPWPHLYEVPVSVAAIVVERQVGGDSALFLGRIKDPAHVELGAITNQVQRYKAAPLEEIKDFRVALRVAGWPWLGRRLAWWIIQNFGRQRPNFLGTFGITLLGGEGVEITYAVSPWTTLITCGPIDPDGAVDVTCCFDHRVMDGVAIARALVHLEEVLNGPIAAEIRVQASQIAV